MNSYMGLVDLVTGEVSAALRAVEPESLDALRAALDGARRVYLVGKGRSGLLMRAFAIRLMHLGLTVHVVDEPSTPAIGAGDLLVVGSGSGRTASLVGYAEKASSLGAKVALITAYTDSPVGQRAGVIVRIPAPGVKAGEATASGSAQPMANLFEQSLMLLLDIVTIQMMHERGLSEAEMFARHANLE
jgi:6-phospho-3-hexuloisomerase